MINTATTHADVKTFDLGESNEVKLHSAGMSNDCSTANTANTVCPVSPTNTAANAANASANQKNRGPVTINLASTNVEDDDAGEGEAKKSTAPPPICSGASSPPKPGQPAQLPGQIQAKKECLSLQG